MTCAVAAGGDIPFLLDGRLRFCRILVGGEGRHRVEAWSSQSLHCGGGRYRSGVDVAVVATPSRCSRRLASELAGRTGCRPVSLHRSGVGVSEVWIVLLGCGNDVSPLWVHLTVSVRFGHFMGLDFECSVVYHWGPVCHSLRAYYYAYTYTTVDHLHTSGHYMYQQFNIHIFYVLPTQLFLCVLCGSENKQQLFPYTALTDWFL